ncbi:TonB-dependent receptor [Litoribacillus peritrichatus]|uniref:Bifunctional siderophore receptor/adhesin Iha n=1 Tax=Litoribacillus peritrichatus TaxID=718191 RepID=A0ABP7M753_9GAMM
MPANRHLYPVVLANFLTLLPSAVFALNSSDDNPFWDIPLEQLSQISVTTLASGTQTPLDKAASVVTVFTEDDIEAMGATDINHVLESVPGLHINYSEQALFPKYVFRGVTSTYNQQALLMINGVPLTSLILGSRSNVWGGMPVKAISRIEVIRGSGSALYGAEAFSGIINIETKDHTEIANEAGVRVGSFDTKGGWLEATTSENGIHASLVIEYQRTDGWDETVEQDAQTNFDRIFGTNASLAPESINSGVRQRDLRTELSSDQWVWRAGFQQRSDLETGPGVAEALDANGEFSSERFNTDFTHYFEDALVEHHQLEIRASYYRANQKPESNVELFPPGAFGGAFPEGLIGNPGYKEEQARLDVKSVYQGFSLHRIQLGAGGFWGDLYDVSESKNFNPDFSPKAEGVVDVSSNPAEVWMREEERHSWYVFAQDEWQLDARWALTTGVRFDHYSDFGSTANPRLALVWATTDTITSKFLYGRAFRAPSFNDLYSENNPVVLGNNGLEPETIDSYELVLNHEISPQLQYTLNLFYYEIDDFISGVSVPDDPRQMFDNSGERKAYGGEYEINYQSSEAVLIHANYAYQKSIDRETDSDVGEAPNHQLYARVRWNFMPEWHLTAQANWVGEQKRVDGDTRDPVDDYTTVDFTLRRLNIWDKVDCSFTVRNLFNEQVRSPSLWSFPSASIVEDIPMAGINMTGELSYSFD